MPFSIRLDQTTVNRLTRLAARSKRPVSDVVREAIERYVAGPGLEDEAMTPYDRLAHLVGRVDSGRTRSVGTGRAFAALLKDRRRARRAR